MKMQQYENAVKKIKNYIDGIRTSGTNLHQETKARLQASLHELDSVRNTICQILMLDNTTPSEIENILEYLKKIDERVSRLESGNTPSGNKPTRHTESDSDTEYSNDTTENAKPTGCATSSVNSIAEDNTETNVKSKKKSKKQDSKNWTDSEDAKKITAIYADVLKNLAKTDHKDHALNELCNLMWRWYEARISRKRISGFKRFRYNVENLNTYLLSIVMGYANALSNDKAGKYVAEMKKWLDLIGVDKDQTELYPFNYDGTQLYKALKDGKENDNICAYGFVLWDTLVDLGLSKLNRASDVKSTMCDVIMHSWNICQNYPEVANSYSDYYDNVNSGVA